MATTGSYTIVEKGKPSHFYIHHDNYPSGAAKKLRAMLAGPGDALADKFLWGVTRAEPISTREEYGRTDYHYEITVLEDQIQLVAYSLETNGDKTLSLCQFYIGSAEDFIKEYITANM